MLFMQYKVPPRVPERLSHNDAVMNYLDLDHGDASEEDGKSPGGRSSTAESNYREIDWVKTKALNDTRKLVENKRKGSEKSTDG